MAPRDEVLGTFSILSFVVGNQPAYLSYYSMADLFRYDGSGRSLTPNPADQAFFSIDGTTPIVHYNQSGVGDYGDFVSGCPANPRVQDATDCPGHITNLGPAETTLLDAIGYDAAPEPGTLLMLGAGMIVMAAVRRRWRSRPTA